MLGFTMTGNEALVSCLGDPQCFGCCKGARNACARRRSAVAAMPAHNSACPSAWCGGTRWGGG
jgi:hypothetical protein